jgi:hypothetical protein
MAKCIHCDYPYASSSKCTNCGSDNPTGSSLGKGGGVIGILVLIFIIYAIENNSGDKKNDNSSSTKDKKETSTKKEKERTSESNDNRIEEKVEEKVEENTKEKVEEEVKVSTNDKIQDSGSATAKSSTAYFYATADINTRSSKYIVKGQDVKFLRKNGDFIYVNFTYQNYFTEGWMLISDFENFRNDQLN